MKEHQPETTQADNTTPTPDHASTDTQPPSLDDLMLALCDTYGKEMGSDERERVRDILQQKPELAKEVTDILGLNIRQQLVAQIEPDDFRRDLLQARCEELDRDLGFAEASTAEQLLIEQIVLTHLRLIQTERALTRASAEDSDEQHVLYCEKRVSAAQRRHVRAIESLTRVRKLLGRPEIQINVAMSGSQQVVSNA